MFYRVFIRTGSGRPEVTKYAAVQEPIRIFAHSRRSLTTPAPTRKVRQMTDLELVAFKPPAVCWVTSQTSHELSECCIAYGDSDY